MDWMTRSMEMGSDGIYTCLINVIGQSIISQLNDENEEIKIFDQFYYFFFNSLSFKSEYIILCKFFVYNLIFSLSNFNGSKKFYLKTIVPFL